MSYQSSPKKKQPTIADDSTTGSAIGIEKRKNVTTIFCKVCKAQAASLLLPHCAHDCSASTTDCMMGVFRNQFHNHRRVHIKILFPFGQRELHCHCQRKSHCHCQVRRRKLYLLLR